VQAGAQPGHDPQVPLRHAWGQELAASKWSTTTTMFPAMILAATSSATLTLRCMPDLQKMLTRTVDIP